MKNTEVPTVEAALSYARAGWPVFPLHNKKPFACIAPGVQSHGYKDATTDEETIQAMWTYHKGATIGLATGSVSGIIVLDLDPPKRLLQSQEAAKEVRSPPGNQEKQHRK